MQGHDAVIVASLDELLKHSYGVGLPFDGTWRELLNGDAYENFSNLGTAGYGGSVQAFGGPLDGLGELAALVPPANGVIVPARD